MMVMFELRCLQSFITLKDRCLIAVTNIIKQVWFPLNLLARVWLRLCVGELYYTISDTWTYFTHRLADLTREQCNVMLMYNTA